MIFHSPLNLNLDGGQKQKNTAYKIKTVKNNSEHIPSYFFFFKDFIYFSREGKGKEGEREGEKHQSVDASLAPFYWGPGPQPRHVP